MYTPSYQEVLNRILKITELNEIFFGKFQIKRPQLEELINPNGRLSGSVISGFLHFYTEDIVAFQELPGLPPPFYIMDISKTSVMASQSTTGIFKPKLNMKTSRLWAERILGPMQQDEYSCGLHIIWVAQSLVSGNTPFEIDELIPEILQTLRETITCCLAREWNNSKDSSFAQSSSHTMVPRSSSKSPPPIPSQTPFNPSIPASKQSLETSPRTEQFLVFYTPSVGSWALWDISSENVYFPAQIVEVSDSECIIEIPGGPLHFEYPVEDIPAKRIVKLLWPAINDDQQLQQELLDKEDKLDEVVCLTEQQQSLLRYLRRKLPLVWFIILGLQPSLAQLHTEWAEYINGVRPGLAYFQASSSFEEKHMAILNAQDKIFIRMIGGLELGWKMNTNGHDSDLSQSLGCAILTYYALAFYLNITPDQAYQAVQQKHLYRPQSQQDVLWSLIYRSSNSIIRLESIIRSHRIPSWAIELPQLVYVPLAPPPPPPPLPPPPPPPPPSQLLLVVAPPTAAPAQISLGSLELKPISSQQDPTNLEDTHQFELTQEKVFLFPSM
ncbi:hypothetical protein M422DRAFT_256021 [Sphaerobolus stellatus SS14]|uniref:Uncharacterized protein n=1 Tax=Sphaerobolus stellatus (strain SS14) TaxID=990650 RepID=A0A0C9VRB7_SPHS4|nr:hypothetical protein M422DRAFT_256021 [Sphaerobolus stellatus SS14]